MGSSVMEEDPISYNTDKSWVRTTKGRGACGYMEYVPAATLGAMGNSKYT